MNPNSDPIDYLINIASESGVSSFIVNNAKDELKRLRKEIADSYIFKDPVAWARINDRGDLFDPRLQNNPHIDKSTVVPLYRKKYE